MMVKRNLASDIINDVNGNRSQLVDGPASGRRRRPAEASQTIIMRNPQPDETARNTHETERGEEPTTSTPLTPAPSDSLRDNPLLPATTQAGKSRTRMKWTSELNEHIMRLY